MQKSAARGTRAVVWILEIKVLFDHFCFCGHSAYSRDLYSHMVSRLCVSNEYNETLDSGDAFSLATRSRYIHFVFLAHLNWATLKALATPRLPS
jgi:hypothetical protein